MEDETKDCAPPDAAPPTDAAPCGSLPECEEYKRGQDKGYSLRRACYVGITTAWCVIVPVAMVFTGHESEMAKQTASALLGLAGTICICYLGAGVIDRQRFLERLGDGFGRRREGEGRP